MIRTTNDSARFNANIPASPGSDRPASTAPDAHGATGAPSTPAQPAPLQEQAQNTGLADLKRLSQSLKPRRHAASSASKQLDHLFAQPPGAQQPTAAVEFSTPIRLTTLPGLPKRRPAGLENVRSLKQQSRTLLQEMAAPTARTLLLSSLFQPETPER